MTYEVEYLSGAPRVSTSPLSDALGPRSHVLGVINAFRALGHNVSTYIVGDFVPKAASRQGSEATINNSVIGRVVADAGRFYYRLKSERRLAARRSRTPDMVYERYALFQALGRGRPAGIPWILEVNALLAVEATTTRKATTSRHLARTIESRTFHSADKLLCVSETLANQVQERYAVEPSKIITLPNGVDVTRFDHVAIDEARREDLVLFVGALYPWQNVDTLVRAVGQLPEVQLEIVGDGPERQRLSTLVAELGLQSRIHITGRVHPDDVPAVMSRATIAYAGHAATEGTYFSPLKLWEYLAAGTPVLSSDHTQARALAEQGYPIVITSGNVSDVTKQLRAALADLPRLNAAAELMRPMVRMHHSWEARIQSLLADLSSEGLISACR